MSRGIQQICLLLGVLFTYGYGQDREFWMKQASASLKDAISKRPNVGVAKNVILFLGDGMGVSTITAARILKGQREGGTGEEYRLAMEQFPYVGLVKTYNTDKLTPDSAGTATAFMTGVKTRMGVLGVDQRVVKGNCSNVQEAKLDTIKDWAIRAGKSVGVVTTARITHATPAAVYAKTCHRDYESDTLPIDVTDYAKVKDIAYQFVEDNHDIQVAMGGGRSFFLPPKEGVDPSFHRADGLDLVKRWQDIQKEKGSQYAYVKNNHELKQLNTSKFDYLFGLFSLSHMDYELDRNETGPDSQPSLSEMVTKALGVLKRNQKGFFLLVEGGRIDHGHHSSLANKALTETIAFDEAITSAMELTSDEDTLIMATADHSHVFTIAGYPDRGTNILGTFQDKHKATTTDGLPMTVVQYTNGPGLQRTDLTNVDTTDKDYVFPNGIPMDYETHGGEDVAVFARGPMSHLVNAVQEQNVLAHIMGYAACIGPDTSHCQGKGTDSASKFCPDAPPPAPRNTNTNSGSERLAGSLMVAIVTIMTQFATRVFLRY